MTEFAGNTLERVRLARALAGRGIEIGPGNSPIPVGPYAEVRFVERPYARGGYRDAHGMDAPDSLADESVLLVDVDSEGLAPLGVATLDFVIACHVVEHLANPLKFLSESARALRPGGKLLLIVPDRERTFDFGRPGTSIQHVVDEFTEKTTEVSREHINAELTHALGLPDGESATEAQIEQWRELTVHAHCWTPAEFFAMLIYATDQGWAPFALEDCYFPEHHDRTAGFEFGLLLRHDDARRGRRAAETLLEDFTAHVAARAPGERGRWSQGIAALMEAKYINLPWQCDPDALFELLLHQAMAGNRVANRFMDDPIATVQFAASHASAPTGLGRTSAYWRGVLAGKSAIPGRPGRGQA